MNVTDLFSWFTPTFVTAAAVLSLVLLFEAIRHKRSDESQLMKVKNLRESIAEIAESEMSHVDTILSALQRFITDGILDQNTSSREELERLDSHIPGRLRSHYEDLDFLIDLNDFLGGRGSFRDESTLAKAYYYAGILAFKYRDLSKAAKRFEQLANSSDTALRAIGVSKARVLGLIGISYLFLSDEADKENNLAKAIAHLKDSYSLSQDRIVGYDLAWALDEVRDYAGAIPVLQEVIRRDPKLSEAKLNLACAFVKSGELESAFAALREIPRGDPIWKHVEVDADLEPLRHGTWNAAFEKLIKDSAAVKSTA